MMSTAVAAWLSQGTIAAVGTGAGRIALLPVSIAAVAICRCRCSRCPCRVARRRFTRPAVDARPRRPALAAAFTARGIPHMVRTRCADRMAGGRGLDRCDGVERAHVGYIARRERDCVAAAD